MNLTFPLSVFETLYWATCLFVGVKLRTKICWSSLFPSISAFLDFWVHLIVLQSIDY